MRIGILEIMHPGHITLIDSLVRIYSEKPDNNIIIFTLNENKDYLTYLAKDETKKTTFVLKDDKNNFRKYFYDIISYNLDVLFIVTFEEKLYFTFLTINYSFQIKVIIHNTDEWFQNTFYNICYRFYNSLNRTKLISVSNFKKIKYFIYPLLKKCFINKVLENNHKFVALSPNIKSEIERFIPENKIETIPFSVFRKEIKDLSVTNKKIRLCIPGLLSLSRRKYKELFDLINNDIPFFKANFTIDLLGAAINSPQNDCEYILRRSNELNEKGVEIITYDNFILMDTYDVELSKADFILGIINVNFNKIIKYGRTKETGTTFAMIRVGKPGILPESLEVPQDFENSILRYATDSQLSTILHELVNDKSRIQKFKKNASELAFNYMPSNFI